jgi:hypothetical protein
MFHWARGVPEGAPKNTAEKDTFLQYFFIQVADLVYHQPFWAGYHLASGEYIITEGAFLCDLMIYSPESEIYSFSDG